MNDIDKNRVELDRRDNAIKCRPTPFIILHHLGPCYHSNGGIDKWHENRMACVSCPI